jgi:nicotinamidase-related amidase
LQRYIERLDTLVIPHLLDLQRSFRKDGCPVFYTLLGSKRLDGADLPAWARRLNEASRHAFGSPVIPPFADPIARLDGRIVPQPEECVMRKTTIGAAASSALDAALRARGITAVVVAGVLSAYCVSGTARELADRDFQVALIEDACASLTEAAHEAALGAFAAIYGWVFSTQEMIATMGETYPLSHLAL